MLTEMKHAGELTARDLARRVGLSLTATRHHLKELQGVGVVTWEREGGGRVGAPNHLFRLSESGEALFPQRYKETLTQLLDLVEETEGRDATVGLLESHFERLAAKLEPGVANTAPPERMAQVAAIRTEQGYMAEGTATFCCGSLTEHHCAIRAVAERFPEVCDAEQRLLERLLGGKVERRQHLLSGDAACMYSVRFPQPREAVSTLEDQE